MKMPKMSVQMALLSRPWILISSTSDCKPERKSRLFILERKKVLEIEKALCKRWINDTLYWFPTSNQNFLLPAMWKYVKHVKKNRVAGTWLHYCLQQMAFSSKNAIWAITDVFCREMLLEIKIRGKLDRLFRLAAVQLSFPAQTGHCQKPLALKAASAHRQGGCHVEAWKATDADALDFLKLNIKNF